MIDFFNGFFKGFSEFGKNISLIVNCLLLSVVYIVGVGITSLFAKLVGKHFLETKISSKTNTKKNTYWSNLNLKKKKIDDYYRQF